MATDHLSGSFGPYTIVRPLGPGNRSQFYRAEHPELRAVRLEIFDSEAQEDPAVLHRHWSYRQLVGKLNHPNLLQVFEAGVVEGRYYLAIDHREGRLLSDRVKKDGPLELSQAAPMMGQILHGLAHAHENGVIHGDLKPEDILMGAMNSIRIQGFGRGLAPPAEDQDPTALLKARVATLTGFSSPEQVLGQKAPDAATDIYRAGALLYWMVTAELPFELEIASGDPEELAEALLSIPPFVPSSVHSGVPWELDRVILKAMEKRPEARFQSPAFMCTALEMVQRGERTWIRLEGKMRYAEWPWLLRITVFIIIAQIAYLVVFQPETLGLIRYQLLGA
jgi:serine/threonine-protein kinase